MTIDNPHFKYPLQLAIDGSRAVYTEQDEDDEILDCVEVLLSTQPGERIDLPSYGLEDQTFLENGVSAPAIMSVVRAWEARALISVATETIIDLAQRVEVNFKGGDVV